MSSVYAFPHRANMQQNILYGKSRKKKDLLFVITVENSVAKGEIAHYHHKICDLSVTENIVAKEEIANYEWQFLLS